MSVMGFTSLPILSTRECEEGLVLRLACAGSTRNSKSKWRGSHRDLPASTSLSAGVTGMHHSARQALLSKHSVGLGTWLRG